MTTDTLLEKRFLLGNVMQIAVLNHAEAFQGDTVDEYFELIEQGTEFAESVLAPLSRPGDKKGVLLQKGKVKLPAGYKKAWEKIKAGKWQNLFRSMNPDGDAIPESVSIAIQEAMMAADPSLFHILGSTMLAGDIVGKYGNDNAVRQLAKELLSCERAGAFALFETGAAHHMETPRTMAALNVDGSYTVRGVKERVLAADHDLTDQMLYLVTAQLETNGSDDGKIVLMAVPGLIDENGTPVDNGVRLEAVSPLMGLKAAGVSRVSFGMENKCRGFLLEFPGADRDGLNRVLQDWQVQTALQGVARMGTVASELEDFNDRAYMDIPDDSEDSPARFAPTLFSLKSINEGLRGVIYMRAFYNDCRKHGAESQKPYFSDLYALYSSLLTAYAPCKSLVAISGVLNRVGALAFDEHYSVEQSLRDLQAALFIAPEESRESEFVLDRILPENNGRIFQQLLKQSETVESHQVVSERLIETIAIWRDYVGGLIVLFDDLMTGQQDPQSKISSLFAGKIVALFGDVVLCYHLIIQAMEAERILAEADVNFYNLSQEVAKKPELREWYRKLLLAEYYAVHELSLQEGVIRLIQRNPQAFLERL